MQFDLTHKYLLIFTIIYLQCISLIKSQYSQIWYDPNVYLRGIPDVSATPQPTSQPSLGESQYSQIWYDPMEDQDCNGWAQHAGAGRIDCGYTSSGGCEENPCVKIESHDTASAYSSLSRTTNIAAYSSL
eukprot:698443_1